ncbi:MAG: thioredoxin [Prevotellaceae bacterium]|jgi:thioredoxin 1|nr:thioredoxin [Prevotellaceae bacterium]
MATQVTESNFDELVTSGKPVLIDFWAEWCGPCRSIGPIIEELATDYNGRAIVAKCDVDTNNDIAVRFGIRSIPSLLFFKDGKLVDKIVGLVSKAQLVEKLNALL